MPHVIEPAPSGRAKCRGCGRKIAKGELRFGERQPNVFAEGEMTLWFHPRCAAYKRPEPFLEIAHEGLENAAGLRAAAEKGMRHRRLPRLTGAERARTGRARCRSCRQLIERGTWRISLVFFEDFRFEPSGFIHVGCAGKYFETTDIIDRLTHFAPNLDAEDLAEIQRLLASADEPLA